MPTRTSTSGSELFIVDNSDEDWKVRQYLHDWCQISKAIDIATGCHKWLKDRKGRTLSEEDIAHYQKIVVALDETIRIMGEIDEVIEEHGGWPGAFQTD